MCLILSGYWTELFDYTDKNIVNGNKEREIAYS
jgi:hypothetical protein